MADVMKLAMERRSRLTAEMERMKDEVSRLNQFIRMGESLISRDDKTAPAAATEASEKPAAPGPFRNGQGAASN